MKNFILLANDPGGYDVISSIACGLKTKEDTHFKMFLTGPSAKLDSKYKAENKEVISFLEGEIKDNNDFLLVTGTSWNSFIELEAIELCKNNGIKTVSILDYWSNYKSRFCVNGNYIFPDYYFVMDKLAFEEAVEDGVDSSIMRIIGTPGLDKYLQKRKSPKKVLFLSQPLSVLYQDDNDGYNEFDAFEGVLKACEKLGILVNIKFHPKESEKMKELYSDLSIEGQIEEIEGEFDAIIGMTTMGLLQCYLRGKLVICYEPHLCKADKSIVNKLGVAKSAFSYEELLNILDTLISSDNKKELPFWLDGKSTERCINELVEIYDAAYELR